MEDFKKRGLIVLVVVVLKNPVLKKERPVNDLTSELQDTLSHHMLGHPYDPASRTREKFVIDHLSEALSGFSLGDYSLSELDAIFSQHDTGQFDLLLWMQSKVEAGHFDPDIFET